MQEKVEDSAVPVGTDAGGAQAAPDARQWPACLESPVDDSQDLPLPVLPVGAEEVANADLQLDGCLTFYLADLKPQEDGAVVIESGEAGLTLQILSDEPIVDSGTIDHLVTASGTDVSGLAFYAFGNGTVIYYPSTITISITTDI